MCVQCHSIISDKFKYLFGYFFEPAGLVISQSGGRQEKTVCTISVVEFFIINARARCGNVHRDHPLQCLHQITQYCSPTHLVGFLKNCVHCDAALFAFSHALLQSAQAYMKCTWHHKLHLIGTPICMCSMGFVVWMC